MRSDQHNASFAAVANTCNLAEINTAALKKFNADLEARAAATEAPTTAQTFEPTATPESDGESDTDGDCATPPGPKDEEDAAMSFPPCTPTPTRHPAPTLLYSPSSPYAP